jgi:hypothetical protein
MIRALVSRPEKMLVLGIPGRRQLRLRRWTARKGTGTFRRRGRIDSWNLGGERTGGFTGIWPVRNVSRDRLPQQQQTACDMALCIARSLKLDG